MADRRESIKLTEEEEKELKDPESDRDEVVIEGHQGETVRFTPYEEADN